MGKTLGYGEITVANMTEPFTVMLTNEAQQFATDSNRKVTSAQSYYTDIIVIRGSQERTDYTIGNITSGSGITVSKTNKRVTFSVSVGTTIGADIGVIEIPITLDGQTVKKQFSWSCGKQGPQGVKGEDGQTPHIHIAYANIVFLCSENSRFTLTESTLLRFGKNDKWVYKTLAAGTYTANATTFGSDPSVGTVKQVDKITDFSIANSTNKTHMGQYADFIENSSSDPSKYTWALTKGATGDKGVDGEKFSWNLLQDSSFPVGTKKWNLASGFSVDTENKYNGYNSIKIANQSSVRLDVPPIYFADYNIGETLYLTFWIMCPDVSKVTTNNVDAWIGFRQGHDYKPVASINKQIIKADFEAAGNGNWFKVSISGNCTDETATTCTFMLQTNNSPATFYVACPMLSRSNVEVPYAPHPEDLEGRGVFETVQYYLATSQASGVTSSTSGWSTDITTQKLTTDKKYLWNCYQTKYSDGTSEPISTPKVIGVYGDKGVDGQDGEDGAGFHWNLLSGTKDFDKTKMKVKGTIESYKYLDFTVIKGTAPTSGYFNPVEWKELITPTPNTQYTISFYAKASVATLINSYFYPNCTIKNVSNKQTTTGSDGAVSTMLSTEWERYSVTWTTSSSVSGAKSIIPVGLQHGISVDDAIVYFCGVKLEQSDKASPWCTTYEETLAKNLSITPSSQYFKSTDGGKTFAPSTITIKPTIQGEISFGKWQYSIDGGVSFADVVSGQKGLTISNNVLTVSKDSSLYSDAVTMVTFRAVANDSSFYDTCSIAKIYDVSELEIGGVNLFVKSTASRGYWLSDTGTLNANGGWGYSDYIDVSGMKNYIASGFTNLGISPATCFYDSNKTFISGVQSTNQNSQDSKRKTLPIPSNAKYMRFSFALTDIDTLKIEQGTKATAYSSSPQDVQTAILSTKSEISSVSSKVDQNTKSIEDRVEKTTYERELTLVKGDISKANEGLNKWRYEIYPKSLFASEYQGKSTMDVFVKNTNLTPSQSVLINDTDLSIAWNYDNNYIGYALTFVKFSAAKSVAITFAHDDGAHIYLNGKLIGGSDAYNQTGESLTLGFIKGWNCIEVVVNEGASTEGFKLGTTISAISECQLMNCYYGTPVARQSHITNQLVQNTTDIDGVNTKVGKVTSVIGENGENFTSFQNDYSDFKQTMNGFKTTVGQTYVTKDDFNGLEIGGRNLVLNSKPQIQSSSYGFATRGLSMNLQAGVTYTVSYCGRVIDGDGSLVVYLYTSSWKSSTNRATKSKENTVVSWQFTPTISGTFIIQAYSFLSQNVAGGNVYLDWYKIEKGNKATDWTPAPEDDEINGQNLVSNLPANWEQGSINYTANLAYSSLKSTLASRLRTKDVFPVSGNITISAGTSTNSSKEALNFYYVLFDINKKSISHSDTWQSLTSAKIINCGDAKYMAIILKWDSGTTTMNSSDISQICLKIERGTSATPFTLAPEDVNGKIVNVETIANQTAKKFEWIVKGGDSSSNFTLTDRVADLVAERINFNGLVTFSGLNTDAKNEIGKVAQSKVDGLEVGGRNLARGASNEYSTPYTNFNGSANTCFDIGRVYLDDLKAGDTITVHMYIKYDNLVAASGNTSILRLQCYGNVTLWANGTFLTSWQSVSGSGVYEILTHKTINEYDIQNQYWVCGIRTDYIQSGSVQVKSFKVEKGNKATDWTPAPEDYLPQASLVSNWTTNTTWIDGSKIYTGSITADKIATDAIKSRNYISSGGTQGSFLNLSDGSFTSPNLSWDSNGNLIAKNANLSGQITATDGSIGKFKITKQWLITGSGSTAAGMGGNQAFWAGSESSNSAPFRVGYDGSLVSIKGKIGKFNLANALYVKNNEMFTIGSNSAKKIFGQNNDGDIYLGEDGISTSAWNTGETYIGDSGTIKADITSSNGICLTGGTIKAYYSSYCKDYPNADNTCVGTLIGGGSIVFTSYNEDGVVNSIGTLIKSNEITTERFVASSITVKNGGLIETAGTVYGGGEIQCGGGQMRIIGGNYGILLRNDGSDFYILSTDSGSQWGGWNSKRPFRINLANGIPYFEYGIIIPNENYLIGNGYQLARGTSWGGVCIGDDSKGLRFYGTSIWASHSISTSDENLKENFTTLDQYEDFYMNLNPIGFNYIGDYDGKKTHFGFGAHKTEDVLESEGYDADEFAVVTHRPLVQEDIEKRFGKDVEVDIETEYGVSYTEFIALNTHMIQKTRRELEQTKQEKADLEARLQAIEAKLGL